MEISSKHNGMRVPNFLGGNKFKLWRESSSLFIQNIDISLNGLIKILKEFRCVEPIPLLFWY